jgi:hypothetical protein
VILGLATNAVGRGRSFRTPAILVLVLATLTQLIYPYLYGYVLGLNPAMLIVLSARNLLYFVLLGWAVVALWRASGAAESASSTEDKPNGGRLTEPWLPVGWPFDADQARRDDGPGLDDRDRLD